MRDEPVAWLTRLTSVVERPFDCGEAIVEHLVFVRRQRAGELADDLDPGYGC
jgi:hypothetical protein